MTASGSEKTAREVIGEDFAQRWSRKAGYDSIDALAEHRRQTANDYLVDHYGVTLEESGLDVSDVNRVIKSLGCPKVCNNPLKTCPTGGVFTFIAKYDGELRVIDEYCPRWKDAKQASGVKDREYKQGNIKTGF